MCWKVYWCNTLQMSGRFFYYFLAAACVRYGNAAGAEDIGRARGGQAKNEEAHHHLCYDRRRGKRDVVASRPDSVLGTQAVTGRRTADETRGSATGNSMADRNSTLCSASDSVDPAAASTGTAPTDARRWDRPGRAQRR